MSCSSRRFFHDRIELCICLRLAFWFFWVKFSYALHVFLFGEAFIEKIIFLLPQSNASKTIFAADAVVAKAAIRRIFEILGIIAVVAFVDIDAFITKLAVLALVAIHAILRFENDSSVKAVTVKICGKEKVAILIFV